MCWFLESLEILRSYAWSVDSSDAKYQALMDLIVFDMEQIRNYGNNAIYIVSFSLAASFGISAFLHRKESLVNPNMAF
jgi:hypothetical protein